MKYAIVTGSTSGIGLSIASELIKKGFFVFLNGRNDFVTDFPKDMYHFIKADLSCMEGMITLVNVVLEKTDCIDCLVLNAGTTCRKNLYDITYSDWQYVMDTNVNIPFFLVQKMLPHMNKNGNILFISSLLAVKPHATSVVYGVSKAAVNALAQNLVKECGKIRVNCICPGFVNTNWQLKKPEWLRKRISSKIALNRFASSEEIANMCINVITNTYINGSIINVDGGYDMK